VPGDVTSRTRSFSGGLGTKVLGVQQEGLYREEFPGWAWRLIEALPVAGGGPGP